MTKTLTKIKENQDNLFTEVSTLLESMASPVRLKIIHFLTQAPHSVEQIAQKLNQTVANTSMHLNKMQREHILKTEKKGQRRVYSLAHDEMKDFWEEIQKFAIIHRPDILIETEKIYKEKIDWDEEFTKTIQLIKNNKVMLLDVRPLDEVSQIEELYKKYVTHIPYSELHLRHGEISKKKPVLILCRGRFCGISGESTFLLKKIGLDAHKLNMSWHQIYTELNNKK